MTTTLAAVFSALLATGESRQTSTLIGRCRSDWLTLAGANLKNTAVPLFHETRKVQSIPMYVTLSGFNVSFP